MLSVWCSRPFASVNGYDAWEQYVNDRLEDAIANGELVPVNIGTDGAWGVRVAVAPDGLTEREGTYAVVTSEPYLLVVSGGEACLSGIEAVGDPAFAALRIPLADGRYAVRTTIVAWNEEPGALAADGRPTTSALSDFVVQIAPELGDEKYRTKEVTFDGP